MTLPLRISSTAVADGEMSRLEELRRVWPTAPRPGDVEFALRDARNMLALLSANIELLEHPAPASDGEGVEFLAEELRANARRLGQLLGLIAALLNE